METIGNKIKLLRKSKGLSLMDLVAKLEVLGIEVSDTAISKIETGKTKSITIDLGKGISKALDISFAELFDIEATLQNQDETESLISEIEGLRKQIEDKTLLIEMLKNERFQIKEFLVSQMVESYSYEINLIEEQISKTLGKEEKENLIQKKENVIRFFKNNKDRYLRSSFVTRTDFINYFEEMRGLIANLPEDLV